MFLVGDMQHGQILYIAAGADADRIDIAAGHAVVPDAGLRSHLDIADDDRGLGDKGAWIDAGLDALERTDHVRALLLRIIIDGIPCIQKILCAFHIRGSGKGLLIFMI